MWEKFLSNDYVGLCRPGRYECVISLSDGPLFFPSIEFGFVKNSYCLLCCCSEQFVVLGPGNISIILGMDQVDSQPCLGVSNNIGQSISGMPLVDNEAVKIAHQPGPDTEGRENGKDTGNAVTHE